MDKERVLLLFDGSNFYHSAKEIIKGNKIIDYKKLIDLLINGRELVGINYYTASLDYKTNPKKYWAHQKFLSKLKEIPKFNVVLCNLKKLRVGNDYKFFIKGDDTMLVHDLLVGAYEDEYDTVIIVSGDEDFNPIINTIKRLGKKVENAYFNSSSSYALRSSCNKSIRLNKLILKSIK